MTTRRLTITLVVAFSIAFFTNQAQQLKEQPACLKKPLNTYSSGIILTTQPDGFVKGSTWMVYTAKNNTKGYTSESLSGEKSFNFMDAFYVLEERADKIRAVEASFVRITTLLDGWNSHAYWFKKSDMLLWSDCLSQPDVVVGEYKAEFNKKAMVINRLDLTSANPASTGFFSTPTSDLSTKIADARDFTILFVYKEENNYYLLGTKPRLSRPKTRSYCHIIITRMALPYYHYRMAHHYQSSVTLHH